MKKTIDNSANRSEIMRRVKSSNTKPEIALRKSLHALGFRFRVNVKDLPGKPDIVLRKHRTVIFVHGCFWHGHDCRRGARTPKTNTAYWLEKISRNMARDRKNQQRLRELDWNVLVVWECEIKHLDASFLPIVNA